MPGPTLRTLVLVASALVLGMPLSTWVAEPANRIIVLATGHTLRDSGLLDVLIPLFEKKTGYVVRPIAVGTGQALAMGKRGDADVLLTHDPEAEAPLVKEGYLINRRQFMHNDFIIVGPAQDPARIARTKSAATAFRQIAEAKVTFVSRGDDSGTHKREQALWNAAGLSPTRPWYVEAGQGMGATLGIASQKQAYTLTDRATFLNLQKTLALKILLEGDPALLNLYSVMEVNPAKHPKANHAGARAFSDFLISDEARGLIRDYGKDRFGQPLYFLGPVK
ncbi:MAG: substrate-binding domain-containing protein [candidate division NC10 bacterium]|nr:substrate-binding domain-containing protein [candidate division NC10 bacterium]